VIFLRDAAERLGCVYDVEPTRQLSACLRALVQFSDWLVVIGNASGAKPTVKVGNLGLKQKRCWLKGETTCKTHLENSV